MNNNFGSNAAPWRASPELLASMRGGPAEPTGADDLFDDATFRANRTTFSRYGHTLHPRGQTFYRRQTVHPTQGLPARLTSSHWAYLHPDRAPTQIFSNRDPLQRGSHFSYLSGA